MARKRSFVLPLAAIVAVVVLSAVAGSPERTAATVPYQDISSAGPLNHIYIGNELGCQVAHTGDTDLELYGPDSIPGDCGTFLVVGGVLYAPDFGSYDYTATGGLGTYTAFTPVSQSAVTGTGTSGDPYRVVTVVDAGATGIRITETDSYTVGNEHYRTDVAVANTGGAPVDVLVYRAGDCFLGGSDDGYGLASTLAQQFGCTKTANNTPPDRIEVWSAITTVDHYYEANYSSVWAAIGAKTNLPDTCTCGTSLDNGTAIQWSRTIQAGGSTTLSHLTTFSPLGVLDTPTPTPTATPTATPTRTTTATTTTTATATATSTTRATATATLIPTERPNVGGAIGAVAAAAGRDPEATARAPSAAAAAAAQQVIPPRTGTGITPPNTGDGGLARDDARPGTLLAALLGPGVAAVAALTKRRPTSSRAGPRP